MFMSRTLFSLKTLAAVSAFAMTLPAYAADWVVDQAHSKVGFSVRHMMISTVDGQFKDFEGTFTFDPKKGTLGNSKFEVKAASIDTGNAKRDEHLRSADFFDAEKFPMISITNSKIKKTGKDKYEWAGDLTLHGVTKPVKFALVHKGTVKDMQGKNRAGFSATTKINRKDWGLTWNKAVEAGPVVSDEVELKIDAEAVEAEGAAAAATATPAK